MNARKNLPENSTSSSPSSGLPRLTMSLLRESVYLIPDWGNVVCRLWHMAPDPRYTAARGTYALELRGLGMARTYCVGQDASRASEIFDLLIRHTVTPCAMADVLEDLAEDCAPLT